MSNGDRAADDHHGRLIDAATHVRKTVTHECARLKLDEGELLHMVVMTWVNDYVDAGLIDEGDEGDEAHEAVTKAMAKLSAKLDAVRHARAL